MNVWFGLQSAAVNKDYANVTSFKHHLKQISTFIDNFTFEKESLSIANNLSLLLFLKLLPLNSYSQNETDRHPFNIILSLYYFITILIA